MITPIDLISLNAGIEVFHDDYHIRRFGDEIDVMHVWPGAVGSLSNLTIKLGFPLLGPHLNACRPTLSIEGSKLDDDGR